MTIVFLHIPKTAGTSFRLGAQRAFGREAMLFDYGADSAETSPLVRDFVYQRGDKAGLFHYMQDHQVRLFGGHFAARRYAGLFEPEQTVTFLRHPVDRVVSHYRYLARRGTVGDDFAAFVRMPKFANLQSTMLAGLDVQRVAVLGVTEHYLPSLRALNRCFGTTIPFLWKNRGNAPRPAEADALAAEVLAANQRDVALFETALARLGVDGSPPGPWSLRLHQMLSLAGIAPR